MHNIKTTGASLVHDVSKLQYSSKLIYYHSINDIKPNKNASCLQTSHSRRLSACGLQAAGGMAAADERKHDVT